MQTRLDYNPILATLKVEFLNHDMFISDISKVTKSILQLPLKDQLQASLNLNQPLNPTLPRPKSFGGRQLSSSSRGGIGLILNRVNSLNPHRTQRDTTSDTSNKYTLESDKETSDKDTSSLAAVDYHAHLLKSEIHLCSASDTDEREVAEMMEALGRNVVQQEDAAVPGDLAVFMREEDETADVVGAVGEMASQMARKNTVLNTWIAGKKSAIKKPSTFMDIMNETRQRYQTAGKSGTLINPSVAVGSYVADRQRKSIVGIPGVGAGVMFLDPTILFMEKQMKAWDELVKEMRKRLGIKKRRRKDPSTSFHDPVKIILSLSQLGLSPNIMTRVDISTLRIILAIKQWRKRALDIRTLKSQPIRHLTSLYDRDLLRRMPVPIAMLVAGHAARVLEVAVARYAYLIGARHMTTRGVWRRLDELEKCIAPEFGMEAGGGGWRGVMGSLTETDASTSDVELGFVSSHVISPLVLPKSTSGPIGPGHGKGRIFPIAEDEL